MPRTVTYKVGVVGHEAYTSEVPDALQELTVEIHELDAEPWGREKTFRYVGHETPRVDGPAKVTGAAKYTQDINRPGLLYAGLLTSPHGHARVSKLDARAAKALKGEMKSVKGRRTGRIHRNGRPLESVPGPA